jgi:hypothetical protein
VENRRCKVAIAPVVGLIVATSATIHGQSVGFKVVSDAAGTTILASDVRVKSKGVQKAVSLVDGRYTIEISPEGPTEVSIGKDQTVSVENVRKVEIIDKGVILTTASNQVIPINLAAPPRESVTPAPLKDTPQARRLSPQQQIDISEELTRMAADSGDVSAGLLREQLMERAEGLAASYLKVGIADLFQSPFLRRDLRTLVDRAIRSHDPRTRDRPRVSDQSQVSRSSQGEGEGGSPSRCECEYCRPLHPFGTGSLPYGPPTVPAFPTMMSYVPMTTPVLAFAPKRCFLHQILCPCSWCRGHR